MSVASMLHHSRVARPTVFSRRLLPCGTRRHLAVSRFANAAPLRLGGVPEHFNGPFHWSLAEGGAYSQAKPPFEATWTTYEKGTGQMVDAVNTGEVDVACLLLEGGVAAIAKGVPIRIIGTYVATPLVWGVHCKADAPFQSIDDVRGKVFGVSRMGSGSHLMACVMGYEKGWSMDEMKLKITGSLDDAQNSMKAGEIDVWLWEKFTTNFLVEAGEWKRIGEVPTPWPCFVLVAHENTCKERKEDLQRLLELTQPVCRQYKRNDDEETIAYVSNNYRLSRELAAQWLRNVDWTCDAEVPAAALTEALSYLQKTEQIPAAVPLENLVADFTRITRPSSELELAMCGISLGTPSPGDGPAIACSQL